MTTHTSSVVTPLNTLSVPRGLTSQRLRQPDAEARDILHGQDSLEPAAMLDLAYALKKEKNFTLARRILARARMDSRIDEDADLRLEIHQQSALCTFKDTDLPADSRLDRALEIIRKVEDLSKTKNQETLGIVGSIYKRKWELDSQRSNLERSLYYYERGYREGVENDQGYTGINAAFVLDLLASQEALEAKKAHFKDDSATIRRARAKLIREEIISKLLSPLSPEKVEGGQPPPSAAQTPTDSQSSAVTLTPLERFKDKWWFYSTVAEAYFGLEEYDRAVEWLKKGKAAAKEVFEWEYETTIRQLARLAELQSDSTMTGEEFEATPAWRALEEFFGGDAAPVKSAFVGKIGLALSGGGFRASLYHIGVLARLAELDVLRRVEVLSCVSGGSIIGAHYYLEVRKLLEAKPDNEITRDDYIEIVKRIERDFLEGVRRNVRVRVAGSLLTNLKMLFLPNHSRTIRVGELYESEIFSKVKDEGGNAPRYLNKLLIKPAGEDKEFSPKNHNWRRNSKVPILILNAATLNTGHSWQFTATWMGEPPAGIDSEIDGNDRLRRMYYTEAPEDHRDVRLGQAVAASACVPGLFDPLSLTNLYPDRVVRLVDGGVCDNQGAGGLLEQDCTVLLVSDGSGQMSSEHYPSAGLLGVPLRANSILQARVREAQYHELSARKRSQLLRGFMFVHLKEDLNVDPVDWVDCEDLYDASDDARPSYKRGTLASFGIAKDVQDCLSRVRTDLDSFCELEAYALMTSGYRMTEHQFRYGKCVEGFKDAATEQDWNFLEVEESMKGKGREYKYLKKILGVSSGIAFKVWRLSTGLKVFAYFLAAAALVLAVWACIRFADTQLVAAITPRRVGVFVLMTLFFALATYVFGKTVMRFVRWRDTLLHVALGVGLCLIGWIAAWIHLLIFDPMYLSRGSLDALKRQKALATEKK